MWLGVDPWTGQHIMFDEDFGGIRMARSLLRMPQPQKWLLEAIRAVSATPWSEHEAREPGVIQHDPAIEPAVRPEEKIVQTRRVYIRQADLVKHGYTKNCPRCQHIMTHGANTGTMPHSEECRRRIMEEIGKTPEGRARIEKMAARSEQFLEDHARRQDAQADSSAQGGEEFRLWR